jgi:hypothetical protein
MDQKVILGISGFETLRQKDPKNGFGDLFVAL